MKAIFSALAVLVSFVAHAQLPGEAKKLLQTIQFGDAQKILTQDVELYEGLIITIVDMDQMCNITFNKGSRTQVSFLGIGGEVLITEAECDWMPPVSVHLPVSLGSRVLSMSSTCPAGSFATVSIYQRIED